MELNDIKNTWKVTDNQLCKQFEFKNFTNTINFVISIAKLAEEINHHPEINWNYCKVLIKITTHSAGNKITKSDYILAEKTDEIYFQYKKSLL